MWTTLVTVRLLFFAKSSLGRGPNNPQKEKKNDKKKLKYGLQLMVLSMLAKLYM